MRATSNKRRSRTGVLLRWLFAIGSTVFFITGGVFFLWASTLTLPAVDIIEAQRKEQSTKLFDRTGEVLLYDMHQDVRRTAVSLDAVSAHIKGATIAIEDSGFYNHFGIEPMAIIRAVIRNLQAGDLLGGQGGSTITQQVVKNLLLVQDKTISRKLKEWVLAIKLERQLSKDEILELYLNEAPYGGTKYGIEEAAQGFFGKSSRDLSVAESAYLASLPQAPTYYSPYGANRAALDNRKNAVLARMLDLGYINEEEYEDAKKAEVDFRPFTSATIKAPHFVFYVLEQLQDMYREVDIAQANLKVITTLDWDLEKEAERIVYEHAIANSEKYNAHNASLMAVDPRNGQILVMVGSRDYFDEKIDGNFNIGLANRQPGSSFKPFAYAAALLKGYTSETVLYDVHTQFSTSCEKANLTSDDGCYAPTNYDDKFRGPMTFRNALAQSVNIPAVKVVYLAGLKETFDLANKMGISTLRDYQRYGLTLVLGGGEVSLLDMTSAYGTFAREGYPYPYSPIVEIKDGSNKSVFTSVPRGEQVLDADVSRTITSILNDNDARTPSFGQNSYLFFKDRDVAVKTGTTNDYRDAWIIGYTPTISVGAWAGNNDNSPMEKKVAGFIVAPMWNEFFAYYFEKYPEHFEFIDPEPLDQNLKPILLGRVGNVSYSTTSDDVFVPSVPHSILHYVNKDDPRGPAPSSPASDSQYSRWEYGVLSWRVHNATTSNERFLGIGNELFSSDVIVNLESPKKNEQFSSKEVIDVLFNIESELEISAVLFYVDGNIIDAKTTRAGRFSITPADIGVERGSHTLLVVAQTKNGERGGSSQVFRIR